MGVPGSAWRYLFCSFASLEASSHQLPIPSEYLGCRHGEHGILKYTDAQTVAIQRLLPIAPTSFLPPAAYAKVMTAAMRSLQRLPGRK
jgi:hypothetical protein